MSTYRVDRRPNKTKNELREAYIRLLCEKPAEKINVRELCAQANINRSTFYLHYENIFHLSKAIEDEIYDKLVDLVYKKSFADVSHDGKKILTETFEFLDENSTLCSIMLDRHGSIVPGRKLGKMIFEKLQNEWKPLMTSSEDPVLRYNAWLVINGFVGVFQTWVDGGKEETPEKMAEIFAEIIKWGPIHENGSRKRDAKPSTHPSQKTIFS